MARDGVSVTHVSPGFVESEIRQVDNMGQWRAEVPEPIPGWLVVAPDRAARSIVRGVASRKREVVVTPLGKLAVFFQRHAPWLVSGAIRRFGVRSRVEPSRP